MQEPSCIEKHDYIAITNIAIGETLRTSGSPTEDHQTCSGDINLSVKANNSEHANRCSVSLLTRNQWMPVSC